MKTFTTRPVALALTLAAAAALPSCAPKQDINDPDQCPDVNYSATAIKDDQFIGSVQAIDDAVMSRMIGRFPGCAVGIAHAGQVAYLKGYGVADFNIAGNPWDDDAFTKSTVVGIGSVSKTLTAMAVMELVEQGHVALNGTLNQYFPHAVPPSWSQLTVRQVLSHRAGFERDPNPGKAGALTAAQIDATFGETHASQHPRYAIWEFLLTTDSQPQHPIGSFRYSNIGYTILGALVDNVTQNGFGDYAGYERFVWSLIGRAQDSALTAALDHHWRANDIVGLAQSYDSNWKPYDTNFSGWQGPAGGWSMTIGDLTRVLIALSTNQVLTQQSLTLMRTKPGVGGTNDYGLGLFLEPKCGKPAYHHGGSIDGFRTQVIVWPNEQVCVAVFANADRSGVNAIAEAVGKAFMDGLNDEGDGTSMKLSDEDRRKMSTATFQVSRDHAAGVERLVQGYVGLFGETRAASGLSSMLRSQSRNASSLVDLIESRPGEIDRGCQMFLDELRRAGNVGPYQPR